ncbi:MAG: ATPase [Candidatus Aenigmatarchaeota archaeon]|nr:MAG: ATPase [Candidatus Aenigmarchaeota archaeon]
MVIKTNWYVLTGGPCSGKSKTLEYLASLGYFTFPEIARVLIDLEMAKGKKIEEIRKDEVKFQNKVLQMKIELENKLSPEQTIFLDRGIPDSVAYFKEVGLDTKKVIEESRKRIYKKVFFMKSFKFEKDYARIEDEEMAERISKLIFEAYTKLGYQLIEVPVMKTIEEKAKFILSRL